MSEMVRCRFCGEVYDVMAVTVTHRYVDCSMWNTPCCGRQADDRMWKGLPDYTKLSDLPPIDMYGMVRPDLIKKEKHERRKN